MARRKKTLQVTRGDAGALFHALKYKSADDWTNEKMSSQLSEITDVVDDDTEFKPPNPGAKATLDAVLAAITAGRAVEVVDGEETVVETPADPEPATEETPADPEPAKDDPVAETPADPKPAKADKPKPKRKAKPAAPKDRFGCRFGSQSAKLAAKLTTESKKMGQLVKESGSITQYNLMNKFMEKGWVEKADDGFKLTDAAPTAA